LIILTLRGWRKAVSLFLIIFVLLAGLGIVLPRLLGLLGEPDFPMLPWRGAVKPVWSTAKPVWSTAIFQQLDNLILEWQGFWQRTGKK